MRKALMGLLMAATMATPLAAAPSEGGRQAKAERVTAQGQRGAERNRAQPARVERQQPRGERRAEPVRNRGAEARRNNPTVRPNARPDVRPGVRADVRADRNRGVEARRNNPTVRPNARPDVRPGARADVRADRPAPSQRVERARTGDQDRRGQDRRGRTEQPRQGVYGGTPANVRHYQELERRNQERYSRDRRADRRDDRRDWRSDRRDHRDWNRNWRSDRRYDWQRYRNSNRQVFRHGRYYAPYRGYNYSRFSIGLFLDQGFYSSNYWINDPWQYRLPPAYACTRWVRYYDDVLLVDTYTGEVLDVIYNFFW